MESEVNYKRVGIFITTGLTVTVAIIIWLSHIFNSESQKNYIIFFEKQSLDGLQKDSAVTMKGIRIGTVKDYEISENNIQRVKVELSIDSDVPIKTDSRAVLKRNFLTGIAKIDIVGGTQNSALLEPTSRHDLPIIPEELTQFEKIADTVPGVLTKIEDSIERVNQILSDKNIENLSKSLTSIGNLAEELNKVSPEIQSTARNFSKLSHDLTDYSKADSLGSKLKNTLSNLEATSNNLRTGSEEIDPIAKSIQRSLFSMQESLKSMSTDFQSISDSYSNPNIILNKNGTSE